MNVSAAVYLYTLSKYNKFLRFKSVNLKKNYFINKHNFI